MTMTLQNSVVTCIFFCAVISEPSTSSSSSRYVQLNLCTSFSNGAGGGGKSIELPADILFSKQKTVFGTVDSAEPNCADQMKTSLRSIDFENEPYFASDGTILIGNEYFQPSQYCIQRYTLNGLQLQVKVCDLPCDNPEIVCVDKCCPWGQFILDHSGTTIVCVSRSRLTATTWAPKIHGETDNSKNKRLHYKKGLICRRSHEYGSNEMKFELLSNNGSALATRIGVQVPYGDFCMDGFVKKEDESVRQEVFVHCLGNDNLEIQENRGIFILYVLTMLISIFFLLLTLIVYVLIWDKQNIHGWTVFAYSMSMFLMLIFLVIKHLINLVVPFALMMTLHTSCKIIALLTHYFFLSTFMWLAVLNFDLWWTFRSFTPVSHKSKGYTRFGYYAITSQGIPLIVVICAFTLDTIRPASITLPNFAKSRCFLDYEGQGPYLYYPIGCMLGLNLIFFVTTVFKMWKHHKSTRTIRKTQPTNNQSQAQLFAKLFLIMGVTWIFEVISWKAHGSKHTQQHWGWIFWDLVNTLQGVSIFVIFVCKKQVLEQLWIAHPKLRPFLSVMAKCSGAVLGVENCKVSDQSRISYLSNGTK